MTAVKVLHIASAVLWLGNFAVTGVWAGYAFALRRRELERFAARAIIVTDVLFTVVFGAAVTLSGFVLARIEHIAVWSTAWTRLALSVVIGAGVVWVVVLIPLEFAMDRRAAAGVALGTPFVAWSIVGWALTVALFGVIYLMVAKPV